MDTRSSFQDSDSQWFAVSTRSRQEKVAAAMLDAFHVEHFLPLRLEQRQWSDRPKAVTVPLFRGYLFVRMDLRKESRLQVLKVPGIVGFVGNSSGPSPIPDPQIAAIRTVLASRSECEVQPSFGEGDRVRVVQGLLAGVEGLLLRSTSKLRLLISIDLINQTLAVNVLRQDVELIHQYSICSNVPPPDLGRLMPHTASRALSCGAH
jgi:transcription antitermination factor NusG